MQVKKMAQKDLLPEIGMKTDAVTVQQEKEESLLQEAYQPTDEGLLQFYMEQLKNQKSQSDAAREEQEDELKALKIAQNIMRGKKVPAKDENFLLTKNFKLYMAAKNIGSMKENTGKAKSVLGHEKTSADVKEQSGSGEVSFAEALSGNGETVMQQLEEQNGKEDYSSLIESADADSEYGVFTRTEQSGKKHRKRFDYNFKDISVRIINAKTPESARQALSRARQKSAGLRRSLKTGDYDEKAVRIALTHAESMERVAKEKIRHLQEEETEKRKEKDKVPEENRGRLLAKIVREREDEQKELEQNVSEKLKEKRSKHRSEEQADIAEADSAYLRAFFRKLQKEQHETVSGAAQLAVSVGSVGFISVAAVPNTSDTTAKAEPVPEKIEAESPVSEVTGNENVYSY